jgi:excisionase family DNA binding protein
MLKTIDERWLAAKCLDEFWTVEEAAEIIGWSKQGVRKAIKEERLVGTKKGKLFLIPKKDFKKFLRKVRKSKNGG